MPLYLSLCLSLFRCLALLVYQTSLTTRAVFVQIFLVTKFGNAVVDGQRTIRNEPAYVKEACAKSLQRLGVDHIDLYYCHRFNGEVPVEDVVGAMKELVQ